MRRRQVEHRGGPSGYAIWVGLILIVWAALAGASFIKKDAAYGLAAVGLLTAFIGLCYVYLSAKQDGVERVSFLNVEARSAIALLIVTAIELAVLPIFCLVYLVFYFGTAWKPVLIELLGLAMLASGVLLVIRL